MPKSFAIVTCHDVNQELQDYPREIKLRLKRFPQRSGKEGEPDGRADYHQAADHVVPKEGDEGDLAGALQDYSEAIHLEAELNSRDNRPETDQHTRSCYD
jgi:hypothetical protein